MRTLVLGGARSGKSTRAEALALQAPAVDYVATSLVDPTDAEWEERIALHRARRPDQWRTIETADVAGVLRESGPLVLVDCVGVWLARIMDEVGLWSAEGEERTAARARLDAEVAGLVTAVATTERDVVLVTNEVGSGVVPDHHSGRLFRDQLGLVNMRLAQACDRVELCVAGIPLVVKGSDVSAH